MQAAFDGVTGRLKEHRLTTWNGLEDGEALRDRAYEIRMRTIDDLDRHLRTFTEQVESRGGHVHLCASDAEARETVVAIARTAGARLVAKSKSMASEEIGLNAALEAEGMKVVETDLGEYIVQLAGGHPEHIIVPAIRQTAPEVAKLFEQVEGAPVSPDLQELGRVARRQLAEVFRTADVGVTGANFAVSETGSICLVTNEGNAGLLTALPRVHVALLGLERLVPTLDELGVLLQLLARSATGQRLTSYTRLVSGTAGRGETDGPEEFHVVVIDNGRSRLRGDAVPGDARLHPLWCVHQRLSGLPQEWRRGVRARLLGADGSDPRAAPDRARTGSRSAACLLSLRSLHGRLPGEDPAARAPPRAAQGPRGRADHVDPGAARLHALVLRLVAAVALPALDRLRPDWTAAGAADRARPCVERGARARANRAPPVPRPPMSREELVERFVRNAEEAHFRVHRGEPPALEGAGVSVALYGLADTGSVVIAASPNEPRARHLVGDVHVSLLSENRILPDLATLFASLERPLPSSLSIVTGPSRSADIEQRMIVGLHGPAEVHIVLLPA